MIHYQLRCSADHAFDGWFRDSAAFDAQAGRGLVACPECGDARVNRALMAPRIAKSRARLDAAPSPKPTENAAPEPTPDQPARQAAVAPAGAVKAGAALPDKMRAALQRLRADVERNCDYVGDGFAEEARRIHTGEAKPRSIYGESTPEQAEALAEDGIEVARIPWLPRADS